MSWKWKYFPIGTPPLKRTRLYTNDWQREDAMSWARAVETQSKRQGEPVSTYMDAWCTTTVLDAAWYGLQWSEEPEENEFGIVSP